MQIKGVAQSLADFMVKLSRKYYQDDWIPQFEFELWNEISEEPELLDERETEMLKNLHEAAAGWVKMDYRTQELEFLTTPQWMDFFNKNKPF